MERGEASAIATDTNAIDEQGTSLCHYQVTSKLGYLFRRQETSDYGVDAQVEIKRDTYPTGRLVGLQIKSGPSWFEKEPTEDGWKFRPEDKHVGYWLGYSLPIFIVFVDLNSEAMYWRQFTPDTYERGPKGGRFVLIPRSNTLDVASEALESAANEFAESVTVDYADNLTRLSPTTASVIQQYAQANFGAAATLAAHLARGRGAPELITRTLLTGEPSFLTAGEPGQGLQIVAEYAHSHGLEELGADALMRAADRNADHRYRYTRNAGLILLDSDRPRSRELLDAASQMSEGSNDVRLDLGLAALAHPSGSAMPLALTPELEAKLSGVDDDEMILTAMARRAQHSGDLQTAVHLTEKAFALGTDSSGVMDALAEALTRRAHSPHAQPGDRDRAIRLATSAVEQLHRWSGPTQQPLATLLRSLMTAGRFADALDRALPAPDGQALDDEAVRPSVQLVAAVAAIALDRPELSTRIIDTMAPGVDRDIARLRTSESSQDDLLGVLDRLDETRAESLLQVVLRLSDLGVDRSSHLDKMVELGMIPTVVRDVAAAGAAAVVDLDAGLPALRLLAETSELAAAKLVGLLSQAGRIDDAQTAANVAYTRYRDSEFAVQRARLLRRLGRTADAVTVATEALSDSDLDPESRRIVNGLLARLAVDRAADQDSSDKTTNWRQAERHLLQCVGADDGGRIDPADVWLLADVQFRLGSVTEAFELLIRHDPAIEDKGQAGLWLSVMQRQPSLPSHLYSRMLDLAEQFSSDAKLSGAFLTTVIGRTRDEQDEPATPADNRPTLPGEQRAAAFASLHAHVELHGDESPFRILQAPTPDELAAQMTAFMQRDPEPLVQLLEMVRESRLPIGIIAAASQRPYASTLAIRPLGYYLATSAIESDATLDEAAARQAPGLDIVVDESALLVANLLDEYDRVRSQFRGLLMPTASRDDLIRARTDLESRSASSSFVNYDSASDSLVVSELNLEEHLSSLARLTLMERAATAVQLAAGVDLTVMEEVAIDGSEAWLAPIALAMDRKLPLWSDDVAQRSLARHFGVEAFGTTSSQQIRTDDELSDPDATDELFADALARRRSEVLEQLAQRVVDAPVDADTVIECANGEAWDDAVALVTVGRPGWWHGSPNAWTDLRSILGAAPATAVQSWLYHAMWGAARLASDEPSRVGMLLAAIAMMPLDGDTSSDLMQRFEAAESISAQRKAHKPGDFLAEAATTLANAGVLNDPAATADRIRLMLHQAEAVAPRSSPPHHAGAGQADP